MANESHHRRRTRFPGNGDEGFWEKNKDEKEGKEKTRRMTKFPGNYQAGAPLLSASNPEVALKDRKTVRKLASVPPRLPISVKKEAQTLPSNLSNISRPALHNEQHDSHASSTSVVRNEDLWKTYRLIRSIDRKQRVKAAYTMVAPVRIVTVKEVDNKVIHGVAISCRHNNLVELMGLYEHQGHSHLVTEYAQVSLKRVAAIPVNLEEFHVATICGQIFDGMEYLETQRLSYTSLNTSNIMCFSDGIIKLGYFEHCEETGYTSSRVLGLLTVNIMQKGVLHQDFTGGTTITLKSPEVWSAEAQNFLNISSFCSLRELKSVKDELTYNLSPIR